MRGRGQALTRADSDYTGAQTKLPKILLNGNNICMVSLNVLTGIGSTRLIW